MNQRITRIKRNGQLARLHRLRRRYLGLLRSVRDLIETLRLLAENAEPNVAAAYREVVVRLEVMIETTEEP